jgi:signal transduction histidine kinase
MDISSLILESTPHCVLVLDEKLKLVFANSNFRRFLSENFAIEARIGEPVLGSVPDDRKLRYKLRLEEVLSGQCTRLEEAVEIGGSTRYFDVTYQPLVEKEDQWDKVVVFFEEITARKRREIRLQDEESAMKDLLATREALLSVISHDLRAPIFQLNGLLFLIRQAAESRDEARLQLQAEDLEERIAHLTHTLDNLLSWSNLHRQSLEPQVTRFPLKPLVEHATGLLKPIAQRKCVSIETNFPDSLQLDSDREMVALILRNLINNAIKFSRESGRIEIQARDEQGTAVLSVTDHGIGIEEAKIPTLREGSHHFSETGTWGERGSGLGLKMCYEFVEHLQGSLQIESQRGEGTRVSVLLPKLG